jgi:hypothetical protein
MEGFTPIIGAATTPNISDKANELFAQYTASLKPNKEVLNLYEKILLDLKDERNKDKKVEATSLNNDLQKAKSKLESLQDKYYDSAT